VLLVLSIYALWRTNKSRKELAESHEIIRQERDRSDNLLLNILPESTANELKEHGRAEPRQYEQATVFFSDFVGFSANSKAFAPDELIQELELFFGGFDEIIGKYGIEKIKTIGDAYMCASGLPTPTADHALGMIRAALEMLAFAEQCAKKQEARGLVPWRLRIGINSGPVIAGVIGNNKFIYDVWGDTVNLASRLETASEAGRINISEATLALIRDEFNTDYRGEIEVKNMGFVKMFFVVGPKHHLA
jgi:class 3 adenylate cyclase